MTDKKQRGGGAKESIVLFCRILKYSDIYQTLSPDDIRQAKFNNPEMIEKLAEVLYALIKGSSFHTTGHVKEDFLAKCLKSLRYPRLNVLFDIDGKFVSSRELLLAIAWYIHIGKVIDHAQTEAANPVDIKVLLLKSCSKERNSNLFDGDGTESLFDKINRLTWGIAQLDLLKKEIFSIEAGNAKRKSWIGSQLKPELAEDPLLLLVLRNPSTCAVYEKSLERKILLLQSCTQWRKVQHVFWLWMDSVLENAPKLADIVYPQMEREPKLSSLQSVFCEKLKFLMKEIQRQRQIYPKSDIEALTSQLQPEQRLELNKEILSLRTRLLAPHHQLYLKFAGKDDRLARSVQSSQSVKLEIERLARTYHIIEKEVAELRLTAREKLQATNAQFPGIVLIRPDVPYRFVQGPTEVEPG